MNFVEKSPSQLFASGARGNGRPRSGHKVAVIMHVAPGLKGIFTHMLHLVLVV